LCTFFFLLAHIRLDNRFRYLKSNFLSLLQHLLFTVERAIISHPASRQAALFALQMITEKNAKTFSHINKPPSP
jgi:hypothetical protein